MVLTRRSGAGSVKRLVLVALVITAEGRKEVIDVTIAPGESGPPWECFLTDVYRSRCHEFRNCYLLFLTKLMKNIKRIAAAAIPKPRKSIVMPRSERIKPPTNSAAPEMNPSIVLKLSVPTPIK